MVKKIILLLGAAVYAGSAMAQFCATDDINRQYKAKHPGITMIDAQLEAEIQAQLKKIDPTTVGMKGTDASDSVKMDIPVVVHIIHDYGAEYVSDNAIYTMINELNELYNKQNASLSTVISPFIPLIGKGHIRFHLATKDPAGNPTHGITRRRSYLSQGGDDQAKFDLWTPSQYLNIWFINHIGRGTGGSGIVAAYSNYPSTAAFQPYYDGLISNYMFINNSSSSDYTVGHEIGHYLNLRHPWGNNNSPGVACGDDQVTDTPPTKGHFSTCNLYDTECALGNPDGPDTTNVQNIMDYSTCAVMFTQGQVDRMRAALRSSTANRSNLWSAGNLAATGALAPRPSLPPTADFSVNRVFFCTGTTSFGLAFTNRSWNDTITSVSWTFSNGAVTPTSTSTGVVNNGFSQPGWVTVSLTANSAGGTNTVTKQPIYIADQNATPGNTIEEFNASSASSAKFPIFDYYNTGRKWQLTNTAGLYDSHSIRYINNDPRTSGNADKTGTPKGDFSDFFTPAYDLSSGQFPASSFVNFVSSGASRSGLMNDVMEIAYSVNCGLTWIVFDSLTGNDLANKGIVGADYTPGAASDWKFHAMNVPVAARTGRTFFRLRYKPGVDIDLVGVGNNFYLDRFTVGNFSTDVNGVTMEENGMEVAPNPTNGNAFVLLKGAGNGTANMMITDVTGKVVYNAAQKLSGSSVSRIEIPAANIYAKGIYMVRVIADTKTYTKKLVVN